VLTGSDRNEDVVEAYDLMANCYIQKPVTIENFHEVVTAIESFWFSVVVLPE
jgi:DNA-binding NarL/FixJ family response regulator